MDDLSKTTSEDGDLKTKKEEQRPPFLFPANFDSNGLAG